MTRTPLARFVGIGDFTLCQRTQVSKTLPTRRSSSRPLPPKLSLVLMPSRPGEAGIGQQLHERRGFRASRVSRRSHVRWAGVGSRSMDCPAAATARKQATDQMRIPDPIDPSHIFHGMLLSLMQPISRTSKDDLMTDFTVLLQEGLSVSYVAVPAPFTHRCLQTGFRHRGCTQTLFLSWNRRFRLLARCRRRHLRRRSTKYISGLTLIHCRAMLEDHGIC